MYKAASTNRHWFGNLGLKQVIMIQVCLTAAPDVWDAPKIRASQCFQRNEMRAWCNPLCQRMKQRSGSSLATGSGGCTDGWCCVLEQELSTHRARFASQSLPARSGLWWDSHQKNHSWQSFSRWVEMTLCQFMALSSEVPSNTSSQLHSTGGIFTSQYSLCNSATQAWRLQ